MALEAQKCLWRLLRIRHPGDEARLDALERAVLLEAGVRLVRDRPLDKYEKLRQLRERLGRRQKGEWVRAEARQVQLVGWWQRRRQQQQQQQMECEEEQALAREQAPADADEEHSASVTPAALSRCSSSLSLSGAASTPASIALDGLVMRSEAGDWDLLSAVSPLTSCDGSLDERSEGGMSSERRRKETSAARAAMLDPVRLQLSFNDAADPHPADPHMHTLVLGDERAMLEDPHTHLRPLLFLHGHSMSSVFFRHLFRDLVHSNRYVVYAVDLLGWGRSSRPPFDELGERSGRCCRRLDRERQVELAISFMVDALDAFLQHSRGCAAAGAGAQPHSGDAGRCHRSPELHPCALFQNHPAAGGTPRRPPRLSTVLDQVAAAGSRLPVAPLAAVHLRHGHTRGQPQRRRRLFHTRAGVASTATGDLPTPAGWRGRLAAPAAALRARRDPHYRRRARPAHPGAGNAPGAAGDANERARQSTREPACPAAVRPCAFVEDPAAFLTASGLLGMEGTEGEALAN
eukprot:ctg_1777.g294